MKALVLAGGSGTRLWPLSRKRYPKQFLKLNGEASLLQQTVERLLGFIRPEDIIVLTNSEYRFFVLSQLMPFSFREENLVLEPVGRNTAPAIALGIKYCIEKLGSNPEEVVFVCPSDHLISPQDRFIQYLRVGEEVASGGYIVTFGIRPTRAETGYGYIKADRNSPVDPDRMAYRVEMFTEKPSLEKAEEYLQSGDFYWNSGMFAFRMDTIIEEYRNYLPEVGEALEGSFQEMIDGFSRLPDISIDYAVMEKSTRVATLPLDLYWNDIGSWDSLYEFYEKDKEGNIKSGDVFTVQTRESLIMGNKRLIATVGIEDCLVIETDDAILIARKGQAQRVREIVKILEEKKRSEASDHLTTYRPWGYYTVLERGERYKIKRIVVYPGQKLSLQKHYHRSEHWVVVKGTAKVRIGDREVYVHENESAYVPKSTLHRLENPGKIPLEIIEVQNGEYVEEDDIERIDDHYGRHHRP